MAPPSEIAQEVLPIQLPFQPSHLSHRRTLRSDTAKARTVASTRSTGSSSSTTNTTTTTTTTSKRSSRTANPSHSLETDPVSVSSTSNADTPHAKGPSSPLAWLSRAITKAGKDERLHYHPNGQQQHVHHHHHNHQKHSHGHSHLTSQDSVQPKESLGKQLFTKATVVTLEKKYATVNWAAEFYCTISSPCFALPLLLYCDPSFRWSAPEIHSTHFTIALAVITAMTSTLYHATLYKIFSSLDACLATIMFYLNTLHLLRSLPDPYALMVPDLIASVVHWEWTAYVLTTLMMTVFIMSWKKTAMLSLLLMVLMIPATIWGFIVHECWAGLGFGLVGLSMFAADRFHFFCGHSWWHLAGGLSLWYGIAAGATSPQGL